MAVPCSRVMSARVLMMRSKFVLGTARVTGGPSIGTRIAGDSLTMIRGGVSLTGMPAGFTVPDAASDACRRSRAIVRCARPRRAGSAAR